ncbi:MAG TPA: site-2 protease family protein [Solirubrobacterales bacterium]|nr:site-2 protease family protein [Solirubrobacterales bacterium]
MPGRSFKVGRLYGIPIGIHPLWLVIVALITWSLGEAYYPDTVAGISTGLAYALGLASALLLFASILAHELGHALVARRRGVEIEEIDLWLLGGVAKLKGSPEQPGDELRYALAGPLVTLAIAAAFGAVLAALPASSPEALSALIAYQALVNAAILGFNLLPAFPLDGGRVLRAVLWARYSDLNRATARAAGIGRGFAYAFVGFGVLSAFAGAPGGLWLLVIGLFLVLASRGEEEMVRIRATLGGLPLRRLMAFPARTVPASTHIEDALANHFVPFGYRSFPVLEAGRPIGLLTIDAVERLSPAERRTRTAGELADRDPSLLVDEGIEVDELLALPGFNRLGRVVVRGDDGDVGLLSLTALERALRARGLAAGSAAPERS